MKNLRPYSLIIRLLCLFVSFNLLACSKQGVSIYEGIEPENDGSLAIPIPEDDEPAEEDTKPLLADVLSKVEARFINDLHYGEKEKLSFLVVNSKTGKVVKSYLALNSRRLASVSKLVTAAAALEEVNNVSVRKIGKMLKSSNNGEASRYVRLAAKAIGGHITTGSGYSQGASCPRAVKNDKPAAKIVLKWMQSKLPNVDWENSNFNDGAGCDYGNQMTPLQVVRILHYVHLKGASFAGKDFEDLLSVSGKEGTWRNRNRDHKGMIFAKTGTLRPNSNLSGYFYAKREGKMHKYHFSVFVEKRGSGVYTNRSRKLIESLLRHWINQLAEEESEGIAFLN